MKKLATSFSLSSFSGFTKTCMAVASLMGLIDISQWLFYMCSVASSPALKECHSRSYNSPKSDVL